MEGCFEYGRALKEGTLWEHGKQMKNVEDVTMVENTYFRHLLRLSPCRLAVEGQKTRLSMSKRLEVTSLETIIQCMIHKTFKNKNVLEVDNVSVDGFSTCHDIVVKCRELCGTGISSLR